VRHLEIINLFFSLYFSFIMHSNIVVMYALDAIIILMIKLRVLLFFYLEDS
jgi:hypothetical protein